MIGGIVSRMCFAIVVQLRSGAYNSTTVSSSGGVGWPGRVIAEEGAGMGLLHDACGVVSCCVVSVQVGVSIGTSVG